MSWMSPLTVPITIEPSFGAPVSASSGRSTTIPAFMELAASSTSGTNRIPSRKSMPTIRIPLHQGLGEDPVRRPPPSEQDVDPLHDLVGQAVVEVLVHLVDELLVFQRGKIELPYVTPVLHPECPNHPHSPEPAA